MYIRIHIYIYCRERQLVAAKSGFEWMYYAVLCCGKNSGYAVLCWIMLWRLKKWCPNDAKGPTRKPSVGLGGRGLFPLCWIMLYYAGDGAWGRAYKSRIPFITPLWICKESNTFPCQPSQNHKEYNTLLITPLWICKESNTFPTRSRKLHETSSIVNKNTQTVSKDFYLLCWTRARRFAATNCRSRQ